MQQQEEQFQDIAELRDDAPITAAKGIPTAPSSPKA